MVGPRKSLFDPFQLIDGGSGSAVGHPFGLAAAERINRRTGPGMMAAPPESVAQGVFAGEHRSRLLFNVAGKYNCVKDSLVVGLFFSPWTNVQHHRQSVGPQ